MTAYRNDIMGLDRLIMNGATISAVGDGLRLAILDAANTRNLGDGDLYAAARRIIHALPAEFPLFGEKQAL